MAVWPMKVSGLQNVLRDNSFFALLEGHDLERLSSEFDVLFFEEHEAVVQAGDAGDAFYVIHSGSANVIAGGSAGRSAASDQREILTVLRAGAGFGEQALLFDMPRSHTIEAAEGLCVLRLPAAKFRAFLATHPHLQSAMAAVARRHMGLNFVHKTGALAVLTAAKAEQLLERVQERSIEAGTILYRVGDLPRRCYMLTQGQIRMRHGGQDGGEDAFLGPGEAFGIVELIEGQSSNAEASATSDCTVLELGLEALDEALRDDGAERMLRELSIGRLRDTKTQDDAGPVPDPASHIFVQQQRLEKGAFRGTHAFAITDSPALAGLACLTTARLKFGQAPMLTDVVLQRPRHGSASSLHSLSTLAEEQGFLTRLLRLRAGQLEPRFLPCVIQWEGSFATILGLSDQTVLLADPDAGLEERDRRDFLRKWNGNALRLRILREQERPRHDMTFLQRFFAALEQGRRHIAVAFGLTLAMHLLGLLSPLAAKWLIDGVLVNRDLSLFRFLLIALAAAAIFQSGFWLARESFWADALDRATYFEQVRFVRRVFSLPLRLLAGSSPADFAARFHLNRVVIDIVARAGLRSCLDATAIVLAMSVLPWLSARLALLAVVCLAAYALLLWYSAARIKKIAGLASQAQQGLEQLAQESMAGIAKIKSLGGEDLILQSGERLIVRKKAAELQSALEKERTAAVTAFFNQTAMLAMLTYGAVLALRGQLTAGSLVAVIGLFSGMLPPMAALAQVWGELAEARDALKRVDEVEADHSPSAAGRVVTALRGQMEFRDVQFRYPGAKSDVLNGISFSVMPGKKIAIVGRSGSGKSTLIKLLAGLYEPSEGSVVLDGADLRNLHPATVRQQVGIVEQDLILFPGTVRSNIAMAQPDAEMDRVVASARLAGAHDFIQSLPEGYDTDVGGLMGKLSEGQVQRIAIARAILTNPRIVLLDEATASLDLETARVIENNLDTALAGTTMFVVAHRLATVRNADRIVVLDGGRVVEIGSHAELMEHRGLYYYLNGGTA